MGSKRGPAGGEGGRVTCAHRAFCTSSTLNLGSVHDTCPILSTAHSPALALRGSCHNALAACPAPAPAPCHKQQQERQHCSAQAQQFLIGLRGSGFRAGVGLVHELLHANFYTALAGALVQVSTSAELMNHVTSSRSSKLLCMANCRDQTNVC